MKLTKAIVVIFTIAIIIYRIFGFDDSAPPKLVVYIVVDQMREDTMDRLGDLFTGGFKYLMDNGVYFSETRHAQARHRAGIDHPDQLTPNSPTATSTAPYRP